MNIIHVLEGFFPKPEPDFFLFNLFFFLFLFLFFSFYYYPKAYAIYRLRAAENSRLTGKGTDSSDCESNYNN